MDNNVENHSWGSKSTEEEGQIISRRKKKTKKTSDANGSRKNQAPSGHASNMHNWKYLILTHSPMNDAKANIREYQ